MALRRQRRRCVDDEPLGAADPQVRMKEDDPHGVRRYPSARTPTIVAAGSGAVPEHVRRTFVALALRHRRAAAARERSLDRLLQAFAAAGLPVILLKGAALAHLIYPSPALRAMADVDVLIEGSDTARALAVARDLGYAFAPRHDTPFAGRMHHLPAATTTECGFRITLEVHLDALSPNQPQRLTFAGAIGRIGVTVQAEGGHYTLVTVATDQVGESEADKLAKRFLTLAHAAIHPSHRPIGAY